MQTGGLRFLEDAVSLVKQDPLASTQAAGVGLVAGLLLAPFAALGVKVCTWTNTRSTSPTIRSLAYLVLMVGAIVGVDYLLRMLLKGFELLEYRIIAEQICIPFLSVIVVYLFTRKKNRRAS
jgi:hypothetical protein